MPPSANNNTTFGRKWRAISSRNSVVRTELLFPAITICFGAPRKNIKRSHHLRHCMGGLLEQRIKRIHRGFGLLLQNTVAGHLRKPHHVQCRDRISCRFCTVIRLLCSKENRFIFSGKIKKAPSRRVPEQSNLRSVEFQRKLEPFDVKRCLIEIDQPLNKKSKIIQLRLKLRFAVPVPAVKCFRSGVVERASNKLGCMPCRLRITRFTQNMRCPRTMR